MASYMKQQTESMERLQPLLIPKLTKEEDFPNFDFCSMLAHLDLLHTYSDEYCSPVNPAVNPTDLAILPVQPAENSFSYTDDGRKFLFVEENNTLIFPGSRLQNHKAIGQLKRHINLEFHIDISSKVNTVTEFIRQISSRCIFDVGQTLDQVLTKYLSLKMEKFETCPEYYYRYFTTAKRLDALFISSNRHNDYLDFRFRKDHFLSSLNYKFNQVIPAMKLIICATNAQLMKILTETSTQINYRPDRRPEPVADAPGNLGGSLDQILVNYNRFGSNNANYNNRGRRGRSNNFRGRNNFHSHGNSRASMNFGSGNGNNRFNNRVFNNDRFNNNRNNNNNNTGNNNRQPSSSHNNFNFNKNNNSNSIQCHRCGNFGHMARNCWANLNYYHSNNNQPGGNNNNNQNNSSNTNFSSIQNNDPVITNAPARLIELTPGTSSCNNNNVNASNGGDSHFQSA